PQPAGGAGGRGGAAAAARARQLPDRADCVPGTVRVQRAWGREGRQRAVRAGEGGGMTIPYTVDERPDTGLTNGKLGIWLFLASEVMLFGALFSTYIILRVGAPEWPHGELNIWLGAINTVILISSSVTMVMAWASLKMNDWGMHRLFLIATFALAGIFLVNKYFEYSAHLVQNEGPWHSTFLAIYFPLTGM